VLGPGSGRVGRAASSSGRDARGGPSLFSGTRWRPRTSATGEDATAGGGSTHAAQVSFPEDQHPAADGAVSYVLDGLSDQPIGSVDEHHP
jgi:hypothetical protein